MMFLVCFTFSHAIHALTVVGDSWISSGASANSSRPLRSRPYSASNMANNLNAYPESILQCREHRPVVASAAHLVHHFYHCRKTKPFIMHMRIFWATWYHFFACRPFKRTLRRSQTADFPDLSDEVELQTKVIYFVGDTLLSSSNQHRPWYIRYFATLRLLLRFLASPYKWFLITVLILNLGSGDRIICFHEHSTSVIISTMLDKHIMKYHCIHYHLLHINFDLN